jgi:hypothetical protein
MGVRAAARHGLSLALACAPSGAANKQNSRSLDLFVKSRETSQPRGHFRFGRRPVFPRRRFRAHLELRSSWLASKKYVWQTARDKC